MFFRILYILNKTGLRHPFLYIGSKFEYTLVFSSGSRADHVSVSFINTLVYSEIGIRHHEVQRGISFVRFESQFRF
jgi:hypothetical protein